MTITHWSCTGLCLAAIAVLLIGVFWAPAAANELVNSGAESGDLSGWTATGTEINAVTIQSQQAGTVIPFEGSYFFTFADNPGLFQELFQTCEDSLIAGTTLILSGWVQTEDMSADDFGVATINVFDRADTVIASASTESLTTPNLTWQPFSVEIAVPLEAVKWEVRFSGKREFGTYINVFWDSIDLSSVVTSARVVPYVGAVLEQNYPNPFNPSTVIRFHLPHSTNTRLQVFDVRGSLIATLVNRELSAGQHAVEWQGKSEIGVVSASGIYFYRLVTDRESWTKKMVLLK